MSLLRTSLRSSVFSKDSFCESVMMSPPIRCRLTTELLRCLESLRQQSNIVVKQLEVVRYILLATH